MFLFAACVFAFVYATLLLTNVLYPYYDEFHQSDFLVGNLINDLIIHFSTNLIEN